MQDLGVNGRIVGGDIKFKGRSLNKMSQQELRQLRGSEIAMIYQEPMASLNPAMRIGKQLIEVPMIHEGVSKEEAMKMARQVVEDVRLPDPDRILKSYPHQLSGGQQQRIVIAMALMSKPSLLILDEPTTALDVTVEAGIVDLVKDLGKKYGTSMLFISHNLGLVMDVCDRICVMYSGEAVETGKVDDVFDNMRHPYTQALFRSIPLPGADKNARPLVAIPGTSRFLMNALTVVTLAHAVTILKMVDAMQWKFPCMMSQAEHAMTHVACAGKKLTGISLSPKVASRKPPSRVTSFLILMISRNITKSVQMLFSSGEKRVVKANETISLQAREAETLAIVGESGCGKSTLAKVLMGLETATSGDITLEGNNIESTAIQDRGTDTVSSIQMVFQNPFDTLNPSMTVGRQIVRALEVFEIGADDEERQQRMLELLDLVKLPREFATRMPRQLSGGQKQRVGIARAFAGDAKIVVADEPVSALDVSVQAAVTELLMEIQREARTTMLFISHDLSIVRYLSDRVVVMYLGHIVEAGTTDQVFAPPYHPYTEALLSAVPIADTSIERKRIVLEGDIPSAVKPASGLSFPNKMSFQR